MQYPNTSGWAASQRALGLALLLVLAAAAAACSTGVAVESAAPSPPEIPVALPIQRAVSLSRAVPGRIEAMERVELRPRIAGVVESVQAFEGAPVRQGDLLYQIDSRPFRAALAVAEADLALARAERSLAQDELERARRLVQREALSAQDLARRKAGLDAANARLAAADARHRLAVLDLSWTEIRAPISGRIGRSRVSVGSLVGPETSLAVLVSSDRINVQFDLETLPEGARPAIYPVDFVAGDGRVHAGTLAFVDNERSPDAGTVRVRAILANPEGELLPGQVGRVRYALPPRKDTLLVAEQAIATDQGQRFVLVADAEGSLQYRSVTLGERFGGLRIIEQGLSPTDEVVVNGLMKVRPGTRIRPLLVSMDPGSESTTALAATAGSEG